MTQLSIHLRSSLAALLLVPTFACTSAEDTFKTSILAAVAERNSECSSGRASDWREFLGEQPIWVSLEPAIAAGRVTFDATKADACFQSIASVPCVNVDSALDTPDCRATFAGTVKTGDACYGDLDCLDVNDACGPSGETCGYGTCVHRAAIGEECSDRPCVADATCDAASGVAGSICTKSPPTIDPPPAKVPVVGDACGSGDEQCPSFTYCEFTTNTCTSLPRVGDSCDHSGSCFGTGVYCDFSSETCVAGMASGAECSQDNDCASGSCVRAIHQGLYGKCAPQCLGE